jgi:hypothetical protein
MTPFVFTDSLRGSVWAQVLGCEVNEKDVTRYELLKEAVISNDLMLDKLIIKVGLPRN